MPLNVFVVVTKPRTGEQLKFLCTYDKAGILCFKCGTLGQWQSSRPAENANLIPTNRLSYITAKPFKPSHSPLYPALSSNTREESNFRTLAVFVARNLSSELGSGEKSLTEEMEYINSGAEHRIQYGQSDPTAGLSESPKSDYDPSEESLGQSMHVSEGRAIREIDELGQVRNLGLTLDLSSEAGSHGKKWYNRNFLGLGILFKRLPVTTLLWEYQLLLAFKGTCSKQSTKGDPLASPPSGQLMPKRQRLEEF